VRRRRAALALAAAAALVALPARAAAPARPRVVRQGPSQPLRTLLFQNFPNPFPTATSRVTCIWFDLREDGPVRLQVFDLRGSHVRTIIPAPSWPARLPAGRYGRGAGGQAGCDPRLTWDGRAEDGRPVTAGVYLLRLQAGGSTQFVKMVFGG
jgi:hypothetical protein